MKLSNIEFMAQAIVELKRVECDFIEYKKSVEQWASILKTACAYANNYMNREVGLILIGVEEMDEETARALMEKEAESEAFQQKRMQEMRAKARTHMHKVQSGETLSSIARKFGTTIDNLCRLNNIKRTTILRPGQILRYS